MRFCSDHWTRLREMIVERGLGGLIVTDPETAVEQLANAAEMGSTAVNFDPLMNAHWAICSNVIAMIERRQPVNVSYLMADDATVPEDPVKGYGSRYRGRAWPRCPLCYINLAHEVSCSDRLCTLDKVAGYDWMLTRAADDAVERAEQLGLAQ